MIKSSLKALDFLKGVARNAPWAMIAIVIHVIVIAVLSVVYIAHELSKDDTKSTSITVSGPKDDAPLPEQPEEVIDRKLVPKTTEAEVVSFEEETFEVTEPEEEDLHLDRGDPDANDETPPGATGGTSFGVGNAPGHFGTGTPSGYATRRVGGGGPKGRRGGPTVGTEKAVLEGLRWLVRHQNPDGSWGVDTMRELCNPKHPCIPAEVGELTSYRNEGLTGLALLAFLGAGFTHDSKEYVVDTAMGKKHYFGEVIKKGLLWLKERQKDDGSFTEKRAYMYNEALATMAMTEAYGLSGNKFFKEPAERGVQFLINAQKISPVDDSLWGWRYESKALLDERKAKGEATDEEYFVQKSDADISVTGWVVMALKSAVISGFEVPPEVMQGALNYAQSVGTPEGLSGYQKLDQAGKPVNDPPHTDPFPYHTGTPSALNMLVRTFVEHDLSDPYLEAAAQHIVKDLPTISKDKLSIDYYYWYYASLALNQFDGPDSPRNQGDDKQKYWGPWKKEMETVLLELQDKSKERDACSRGGWLIDGRWSHSGHALYNTAINTLTLEVYYRYANAFGGGMREQSGPQVTTGKK